METTHMKKPVSKVIRYARLSSRIATLMSKVRDLQTDPLINGDMSFKALESAYKALDKAKFAIYSRWCDEPQRGERKK